MLFFQACNIVLSSIVNFLITHFSSLLSFSGLFISFMILKSTIKAINEQNRPFISFSIEPIKKPTNLFFVIRNTGNRTAESVEITSTPKLESLCSKEKQIPLIMDKDGKINISCVAPNQEIKSFFDHGLYRYKKEVSTDDKIVLTIKYNYKKKLYDEKMEFDFSYIKSLAPKIDSPEDIEKNIMQIANSIKSIDESVKSK